MCMYTTLLTQYSCHGPGYPETAAKSLQYFCTLITDEAQRLQVKEHTSRSASRRQLSNLGSSGISPFGWRFVYVLLEGDEVLSHISISKDCRANRDKLSLVHHLGEQEQMKVLLECGCECRNISSSGSYTSRTV